MADFTIIQVLDLSFEKSDVTADSKYTIILATISSLNQLTSVTVDYGTTSVPMKLSNAENVYYALINFPNGSTTITVSATDGVNSITSAEKVITKSGKTNANYSAINSVLKMHQTAMKGQYIVGGYYNSNNDWVDESLELEIDITGAVVHMSRSRLQFDIGGQYRTDDLLLYTDYNLKDGSIVTYNEKTYRIIEKRDDTMYIVPYIYVMRDIVKDVANNGGEEIWD